MTPSGQSGTIRTHKSPLCVWEPGQMIAYYTPPRWPAKRGTYFVTMCTAPRELAEIGGPSWAAVCRAVCSLGFTRPHLKASDVRR